MSDSTSRTFSVARRYLPSAASFRASRAFAVADHQVAHVYVRDPDMVTKVRDLLVGLNGIDEVFDQDGKRAVGLDTERAIDLREAP